MRQLARRWTGCQAPEGRALRSESGQAVLEYILILVVVVGIILGVMYQLDTAFKKYVQSYFGDYIACLLETGEMPSLGAGDGANQEICSASFEPFSLKNGRPFSGGGGGGKGDGSSSSHRYAKSGDGGGGGSHVTPHHSTMNGERLNSGGTVVSSGEGKNKKASIKRPGGISSGNFKFKTSRNAPEEVIRIDSRFITSSDKEKKDESGPIKAIKGRSPHSQGSRQIAVDMEKFRPTEKPPDVKLDLSAGDYLRYILIFAILMGIFVFFGGQLNQLRKSWDSSE